MLNQIISLVSGCVTFLGGFLVVWGAVSLSLIHISKEAAVLLCVSQSTIYRLFNSGELASFKVRNARRTSTAACEDYIRKQQAREATLCRIRKG